MTRLVARVEDARQMLTDLYELVEALDRRVPRLAIAGEDQIAQDAAELRERAMSLILRIEGASPQN